MISADNLSHKIDSAIRFFLYLIIFWLPYSPAVIESSVITSVVLFVVKRVVSYKPGRVAFISIFRPRKTFLDKEIAMFLIVCIISTLLSRNLSVSAHGFFSKTLEWFVVFYLAVEVFKEKKHFICALIVFMITSFATVIDGLLQYYFLYKDIFRGQVLSDNRMTAGFSHANGLGAYLIIWFFIALALFKIFNKNRSKLVLLLINLTLIIWAILLTGSRSAWFSIIAGIGLLLFIVRKRLFIVFTIVLLLCLFLYPIINKYIPAGSRVNISAIESSFSWRAGIWQDSFKMIKERPLLGHGLNTYMKNFQDYRRKYLDAADFSHTYAHNCYVQMTVEIGVLGLLSFLWLIIKYYYKLYERLKKYVILKKNILVIFTGLIASTFSFLIQSFLDTNLYSLQLSLLFWLVVGITAALYNNLDELI